MSAWRDVMAALRVDLLAAEAAAALEAAGIPAILLRGPAVASRLDDPARTYVDVDLLVPPAEADRAGSALEGLGLRDVLAGARAAELPVHARTFARPRGAGEVDLHTSLVGAGARPQAVWDALSADVESLEVARRRVAVLGPGAQALVIALHAAQHGRRQGRTRRDLELALRRLARPDWERAASLAERIAAVPALAAGLRLTPAGAALADELGLVGAVPPPVALRASSPPPTAEGFAQLVGAGGWGEALVFLARKLMPSRPALRRWSPLARRGRLGLALAYLWRPLWLLVNAPRGMAAAGLDLATARAALWAWRASRRVRSRLTWTGLADVPFPRVPRVPHHAERGVHAALGRMRATCLVRASVLQAWHAGNGRPRDLVIGVRAPGLGFAAHAWLDGERPCHGDDFQELVRRPPVGRP